MGEVSLSHAYALPFEFDFAFGGMDNRSRVKSVFVFGFDRYFESFILEEFLIVIIGLSFKSPSLEDEFPTGHTFYSVDDHFSSREDLDRRSFCGKARIGVMWKGRFFDLFKGFDKVTHFEHLS